MAWTLLTNRTWLGALVLSGAATFAATQLLAKHKGNAGPEDPPIKFKLPPPKPLSVEEEQATFKIQGDFRIECVAAEPLVEEPITVNFDGKGRMWVCEFRGYMHDVDGKGEDQPIGRIKVLEDTTGSGKFDKATIFLDQLIMPRAVLPTRGGALIGVPPNLTFYKEGPDGKATDPVVVATNFGTKGGQPEHMANSLTAGLDNWIYTSKHPARFRYRDGKWVSEPVQPMGQWGLSIDDYGRTYFNYNSDVLRADLLPPAYFNRNPLFHSAVPLNVKIMQDQRVWPSHQTPGVNRGYDAVSLSKEGKLTTVTATCGSGVYRGDLLPAEYLGNVFVPEPSANLVKRVTISEHSGELKAENTYNRLDFLTSTDERFRPVNMLTGPEGALYMVDLYRGILQHQGFLTNYLIKNIKERNLEMPIHKGRIWRIVPTHGTAPAPTKMPTEPKALVALLAHPNGWVRSMAQQTIVERNLGGATGKLQEMVASGPTALSRIHALWTLEGLDRLETSDVATALNDPDAKVRATAVRLSEQFLVASMRPMGLPPVLKLINDADTGVQLQMLLTLSGVDDPAAIDAIASILSHAKVEASSVEEPPAPTLTGNEDPLDYKPKKIKPILADMMCDSVLSGVRGRELEVAEALVGNPQFASETSLKANVLSALAQCVLAEHRTTRVKHLLEIAGAQPETAGWRRLALLQGMVPKLVKAPKGKAVPAGPTVKLIYLDAEPEALAALSKSPDKKTAELATRVGARIAWPGKPGVPPPPKVIPLTAAQQEQFEQGKAIFNNVCASCHQPSGLGMEGLAPPLVDSEWVTGPVGRPIRIIMHGLNGPVGVAGKTYNLEMPPLATFKDEEIAAVLTYIRREWEHNASPVSMADVEKARSGSESRGEAWTAKELQQVK